MLLPRTHIASAFRLVTNYVGKNHWWEVRANVLKRPVALRLINGVFVIRAFCFNVQRFPFAVSCNQISAG